MPHGYLHPGKFRILATIVDETAAAANAVAIAHALKKSSIHMEEGELQTVGDRLKSLWKTNAAHKTDMLVCSLPCSETHIGETLAILNAAFRSCGDYNTLKLSRLEKHPFGFAYDEMTKTLHFRFPPVDVSGQPEHLHNLRRDTIHRYLDEIATNAERIKEKAGKGSSGWQAGR